LYCWQLMLACQCHHSIMMLFYIIQGHTVSMGYMKSITLCVPLFFINKILNLIVISYVTLLTASLFLVIVTFSCCECFSYHSFSSKLHIPHNYDYFSQCDFISYFNISHDYLFLYCTSRYKSIAIIYYYY